MTGAVRAGQQLGAEPQDQLRQVIFSARAAQFPGKRIASIAASRFFGSPAAPHADQLPDPHGAGREVGYLTNHGLEVLFLALEFAGLTVASTGRVQHLCSIRLCTESRPFDGSWRSWSCGRTAIGKLERSGATPA